MAKKIKLPTTVTTSMAEVGLVRSMPFFIMMVVKLIRSDDRSASVIAICCLRVQDSKVQDSKVQGSEVQGSKVQGSEVQARVKLVSVEWVDLY
jgi:hypothetical protein